MKINYHSNFVKHFKKRIENNPKLVQKYKERVLLFESNRLNPVLKDHGLTGARIGQRAFGIAGDTRVIYIPVSSVEVIFVDVGSHNQVY